MDTKLAARPDWRPHPAALARAAERPIDASRYRKYLAALVPPMLKRCQELARENANMEIAAALVAAESELGGERARLSALRQVNPSVSEKEIAAIDIELEALCAALPRSLLRLDALRFVCSPDFVGLR